MTGSSDEVGVFLRDWFGWWLYRERGREGERGVGGEDGALGVWVKTAFRRE